jgi:LysR family transcriptional activator of nhaA
VVGVVDVIPKRMASLLLAPAVEAHPNMTLVCREGPLPQLLAGLAVHELDVVIADVPASEEVKVKAFNHRLGDCGTTFFGASRHAQVKRGFPRSLQGAPMLLPAEGTALRRALEAWFDANGLRPEVAGEFDDSALMKAFGARGLGVFAAPAVLEDEIRSQYDVQVVGRAEDVREVFYAITVERRLRHPAVVTLAEAARDALFGKTGS